MVKKKKVQLQSVAKSTSIWKLLVPIFLGITVILWIFSKNFDSKEFLRLSWNLTTVIFLLLVIVVYVIRHLSYSWRLRTMSHQYFSWKKSIELIFLWEFASTISPTALGGSASAIIFLTQERYGIAKSVALILYSVVLDTLYFLLTMPLFFLLFGPIVLAPGLESVWSLNGYAWSFWLVYILMFGYGFFFFYGLFIDSNRIAKFLNWLSRLRWLRRFKESILETAEDIVLASKELQSEGWSFHGKALVATSIAWLCRFATIPLIVFAVIQIESLEIIDGILMLTRQEAMFMLTAFSPTPGGSGVAEALFGGFFTDYLSDSASVVVAVVWRILTYYSYLIAGTIILPLWIRKILKRRKVKKNELH